MADDWASDANEAVSLLLVPPPPSQSSTTGKPFPPSFTYQIGFGQEETIFGYSDLAIRLTFSSFSLKTLLTVTFSDVNEETQAKIDDIPGILEEFLPSDAMKDPEAFEKVLKEEKEDRSGQKPLGDKVGGYSIPRAVSKGKGKRSAPGSSSAAAAGSSSSNGQASSSEDLQFEVYRTTFSTPGWLEFHRRMQLFALLYIEGASYISEEEQNWEWLTLWEKWTDDQGVERYGFVGYTSLYHFYHYPDSTRLRLSQFLILPPYHQQGHGTRLYQVCYEQLLSNPRITELTVEDPNEQFDRLRDTADLKTLLKPQGIVSRMKSEGQQSPSGSLAIPLKRQESEHWRKQAKLAKRQWQRLIEMIQLLELDPHDKLMIKRYRLQVKARLYRFNKDVLTQLELEERKVKLQETYENLIEGEYGELVGVGTEEILDDGEGAGQANGKRRRID